MKTQTRGIKPFLDTNVLIYAFAKDDGRADVAESLLAAGGVISVQCLNELANTVPRKLGMPWNQTLEALQAICTLCPTAVPVSASTHDKALFIVSRHKYHLNDALIIAAAIEAGCTTIYSEDMHDGQLIEGIRITNPFVPRSTTL